MRWVELNHQDFLVISQMLLLLELLSRGAVGIYVCAVCM